MNTQTVKKFDVTHKMVLGLALPITLAYLTTPLLGLVDLAVVGRMGSATLIAGLAVGAIIVDMLFALFAFLRMGTTGLTSQAFGANNNKEVQAILIRALVIAFIAGVIILLLNPLIIWAGLYFINPGEEVAKVVPQYLSVRLFGTPFSLANYALLGWLIGLGRSGLGLLLQILLNGTNIVLSILLGLTFNYGFVGVAWATLIAEVFAFLCGAFICWQLLDKTERPNKQSIFQKAAMLRLANVNIDIMIRSFALLFAFAFFTAQGAKFGELTLAANAVLMNFFLIGGYFLDGLATAAEQIVGRAIGANYKPAFWRGLKLTMFWNFLLGVFLSAALYVFGTQLIALITTLDFVQNEANKYLLLAALTPLSGFLAFQMDGVFIGATWSRDMSLLMLASVAIYLASWFLFMPLQNLGLWLAIHIFLLSRGVLLCLRVLPNVRKTFS
ncbi:MAG: MATE family efflux transporter [Nitratireductor sp.]